MLSFPERIGSRRAGLVSVVVFSLLTWGCGSAPEYDMVIRGGTLYDGSGGTPVVGDLAISGDTIVAM